MGFKIHVYKNFGEELILETDDILDSDKDYFLQNKIKVSFEQLNGEPIAYGCPYSDKSEESEVIVLGNNKTIREIFSELAIECKKAFK